jgi:hypothetical protein
VLPPLKFHWPLVRLLVRGFVELLLAEVEAEGDLVPARIFETSSES